MFIDYGVNDHGDLVYIDQVIRGPTGLKCPYCGGILTAKKGAVKAHHFAHTDETCRQVERDQEVISLPVYDRFNLKLPGKAITLLERFVDPGDLSGSELAYLESLELIHYNEWQGRTGGWELTKTGKIPLGQLSLMLFNQFQEPLILERHQKLEELGMALCQKPTLEAEYKQLFEEHQRLHQEDNDIFQIYSRVERYDLHDTDEWKGKWQTVHKNRLVVEQSMNEVGRKLQTLQGDLATAMTDLRLYRAQWHRILSCSLYLLKINDGYLYKIGVTTRDIQERIAEVEADLRSRLGSVKIEVLGRWPGRGNVELYFKYRYQAFNHPMDVLTEYFKFDDVKPILRDLRRMKPKVLTDLERALLAGEPSALEKTILAEANEQRRRQLIRRGMQFAAKRGKHIGRPRGIEALDVFLTKPQSVAVQEALEKGMSLREAARHVGVSVNTVRKVKSALQTKN